MTSYSEIQRQLVAADVRFLLIGVSQGVEIPVARLEHIVQSKRDVGRPKDLLFFSTHEDLLKTLLEREISLGTEQSGNK